MTEESYDFEANKALIKHYIIFPEKTAQEKVVTVSTECPEALTAFLSISILTCSTLAVNILQMLLKALLNLPATDFTLLLYLIPEKLQADVSQVARVALQSLYREGHGRHCVHWTRIC